jgi:hypothetical protein
MSAANDAREVRRQHDVVGETVLSPQRLSKRRLSGSRRGDYTGVHQRLAEERALTSLSMPEWLAYVFQVGR